MEIIGHIKKLQDETWAKPHLLIDHLLETALLSEKFAATFNSSQWGKAIGLSHDAGKGREEWQAYLRNMSGYDEEAHLETKAGKIPHAVHGAHLVEELYGKQFGRILSYGIAGHHAGLQDWNNSEGAGRASLFHQLSKKFNISEISPEVVDLIKGAKPSLPPWKFGNGLDLSLWIRMLYSCLVDADFLSTEKYMNETEHELRGYYYNIDGLLLKLNSYVEKMEENTKKTNVNKIRMEILKKSRIMAKEKQGIFSLSAPTGGGKTLSGLTFALEHAKKNNLRRVIYVIPYTSIIEQTADIFKSIFGSDQVVEHHSNLSLDDETPKTRLASENWDAPLIVTTSVQFFESLFSAKASKCRKIHNISSSVVVFDEAQILPVELLNPILETINLLVKSYNTSVVFSTATQPAFKKEESNARGFKGFENVKEIVGKEDEVESMYKEMVRNEIHLPKDLNVSETLENIANELVKYPQVLCIVSDRKSCKELHQLMPSGTYSLSTLMCGEHRSKVIREIKEKLKLNEPVRVISTQLIEAGVDVDFPVVYKSFAGIDSIFQAAGRCNREGKLQIGKVVVFILPRAIPSGMLRKSADVSKQMILGEYKDLFGFQSFTDFYKKLYQSTNSLDVYGISELLSPDHSDYGISFRTASEKFKMIDDSNQKTIIVRYGENQKLIEQLYFQGASRTLMRKLQRYSVTIYINEFNDLQRRGVIEELSPGIFVMTSTLDYSDNTGLNLNITDYDPNSFII